MKTNALVRRNSQIMARRNSVELEQIEDVLDDYTDLSHHEIEEVTEALELYDDEVDTSLIGQAEIVADDLGIKVNTVIISSLEPSEVEEALEDYVDDNALEGETNIVISMSSDEDDFEDDDYDDYDNDDFDDLRNASNDYLNEQMFSDNDKVIRGNGITQRNAVRRSPVQPVLVYGYERDSPYSYEHEVNDYYRAAPNTKRQSISDATAMPRTAEQKLNRYNYWSGQAKDNKPKSMRNSVKRNSATPQRNGVLAEALKIKNGVLQNKVNAAPKMFNGATEGTELFFYIINDNDLYRQQGKPIIDNLRKKVAKGVFKKDLAIKLYGHLADNGAQKYVREHGSRGDVWYNIFTPNVRRAVAAELFEYFEDEIMEARNGASVERKSATPQRNGIKTELENIIAKVKRNGILSQTDINRACVLAEALKIKNGVLQNKVNAALKMFNGAEAKRNGAKKKTTSKRKTSKQ